MNFKCCLCNIYFVIYRIGQRRIQVLWGLKVIQLLGPSLRNRVKQNTYTELGTKVNIYFGPLPGPWKGPMQMRGPET
jgi:hypothetical protein